MYTTPSPQILSLMVKHFLIAVTGVWGMLWWLLSFERCCRCSGSRQLPGSTTVTAALGMRPFKSVHCHAYVFKKSLHVS